MKTLETTTVSDRNIEKTGIKYGSIIFVSLVAYFLLMRALGLAEIMELRMLNFVFLAAGIVLSLKTYSPSGKISSIEYFEGIKTGLYTSAVAVGLFTIFTTIYLYADHSFLASLNDYVPYRFPITPMAGAAVVLIEGFASGAVITFVAMQYFKKEF